MTPLEILTKVRDEILTDESRWTQGAFARTAQGRVVAPESKKASKWCLVGSMASISRVSPETYGELFARVPVSHQSVGDWNDSPTRTFSDVRALLDRTIADLEVKEA